DRVEDVKGDVDDVKPQRPQSPKAPLERERGIDQRKLRVIVLRRRLEGPDLTEPSGFRQKRIGGVVIVVPEEAAAQRGGVSRERHQSEEQAPQPKASPLA